MMRPTVEGAAGRRRHASSVKCSVCSTTDGKVDVTNRSLSRDIVHAYMAGSTHHHTRKRWTANDVDDIFSRLQYSIRS